MLKKIIVLAASALFSLNASAGCVQYNVDYSSSSDGRRGFIVQHDSNQSIAFFWFQPNDPTDEYGYGQQCDPLTGDGSVLLAGASTYFRNNGPTNFTIHDDFGGDHDTDLGVTFSRTSRGGFRHTASYAVDLWANFPPAIYSGTVSRLASRGAVDPALVDYLDELGAYDYGIPRIVADYIGPNEVPEPTSLALLALGAAGAAGESRKRKPAW